MKLCINCKFFERSKVIGYENNANAHKCRHPKVAPNSPVDGRQADVYCFAGRSVINVICGHDGRAFEPAEA